MAALIVENIENSDLMLEKVKKAAQKAGIHEVIEGLPKGYQTILSRWMTNDQQGVDLSGGQWQKVALARLFVREA